MTSSDENALHASTGELITEENSIELCNQSMYIDSHGQVTYFNRTQETIVEMKPKRVDSIFARIFQYQNLLYVGNFINGWSSASMTTITFSYLEDIAPPSMSAIYESAYYATGAFGVSFLFYLSATHLYYKFKANKRYLD